jgi:hypothetical protein
VKDPRLLSPSSDPSEIFSVVAAEHERLCNARPHVIFAGGMSFDLSVDSLDALNEPFLSFLWQLGDKPPETQPFPQDRTWPE